jgi:ABC-type Mn2+/Zn2+ transport system permease subunit
MLHYLLMAMLAVTIVISVQTVGVALMMAMLVTPAAAAYMLTRRLIPMILTAVGIGAFSAVAGLYISYYTNVVSGAAIVLVATAIFLLTMVFAPQRGGALELVADCPAEPLRGDDGRDTMAAIETVRGPVAAQDLGYT